MFDIVYLLCIFFTPVTAVAVTFVIFAIIIFISIATNIIVQHVKVDLSYDFNEINDNKSVLNMYDCDNYCDAADGNSDFKMTLIIMNVIHL